MYTIKIHYETGNSFGKHDEIDYVGCVWENLDAAKEALKCIKEHHKYYQLRTNKNNPPKKQYWYLNSKDKFENEMGLKVKLDNGELQIISAFWIGYFEKLQYAEIVLEEDKNLFYEP